MVEIQHEMLRMRSEPPSEEELLNLKGYLQNSLLSGFKSPISASLTLRRLRLYPWLGEGYFDNLIDSIARLDGSSLLRECCQFFSPERYTVVVAGQPQ